MFEKKDFGNDSLIQLRECDLVAPTVDANSSSVDLLGYDGCLIIIGLGESNDSLSGSTYLEFEVETSDNDSDWTDATDSVLSASVTGTNTGTIAKIDDASEDAIIVTSAYLGRERYLRVVVNVTGTHTSGTPLFIGVIRTRKKYA